MIFIESFSLQIQQVKKIPKYAQIDKEQGIILFSYPIVLGVKVTQDQLNQMCSKYERTLFFEDNGDLYLLRTEDNFDEYIFGPPFCDDIEDLYD